MKVAPAVKTLIKVAVSAGLLLFLLGKISIEGLVELVRTLDWSFITLAMFVFFCSNLIGTLQWHLLLRSSGVELAFPRAFRLYFVGLFFNNFLPANIGGDAVKVYDVTRIGTSVYQVIAVTLLDRLIGIFSLCLLAAISGLFLMKYAPVDSLGLYVVIFAGCMIPLLGFYFIEPLGRLLRRIIALLHPLSIDKKGTSILDTLSKYKAKKTFVMRLILLSLVIQGLRVSTHILVGLAIGISIDFVIVGLFFVFVPLLSLAMIPPITINGLGIREALGILLFAQAGIDSTNAFALEFLTYLVSVSISLLGLVFFLTRREAAAEPRANQRGI